MQYWGRILGTLFGFMFGRLVGAILGFSVGYFFDKSYSDSLRRSGGFSQFFSDTDQLQGQAIFFHALFSCMGHVAKADGKVTRAEIDMASQVMAQMGLEGDTLREAQAAFREGKSSQFPLKETLKEFYDSCHGRRDVMQIFLEILIQAAYVDQHLDDGERRLLHAVAKSLGFRVDELDYLLSAYEAELRFRQHSQQQRQSKSQPKAASVDDAYKILGIAASTSDSEVKKAYRRLMNQHHPDKLIAKGLPPQAIEMSKEKAQDIQAAYELIMKVRKP